MTAAYEVDEDNVLFNWYFHEHKWALVEQGVVDESDLPDEVLPKLKYFASEFKGLVSLNKKTGRCFLLEVEGVPLKQPVELT